VCCRGTPNVDEPHGAAWETGMDGISAKKKRGEKSSAQRNRREAAMQFWNTLRSVTYGGQARSPVRFRQIREKKGGFQNWNPGS